MLKRWLLLQVLLFFFLILKAQQANSIKLKVEGGVLWDAVDGKVYLSGPFLNLEPKLNISRNILLGLMLEGAINTQIILTADPNQFYINNDVGFNGVVSIGPTLDYYFTTSDSSPYVGIGFIHSFLTTTKKGLIIDTTFDEQKLSVDDRVGVLLRMGTNLHKVKIGQSDLSRFMLGLKFNYIPKANIELSGQRIGTIATSNLALSIGRVF